MKALLTLETFVKVRIGDVLWWVVCGMFFMFLFLVDNPVETNGD